MEQTEKKKIKKHKKEYSNEMKTSLNKEKHYSTQSKNKNGTN